MEWTNDVVLMNTVPEDIFQNLFCYRKQYRCLKCQLIAPNLIFYVLYESIIKQEFFFPMDSTADKTVAQILKTAFMKSSYFVTSASISV